MPNGRPGDHPMTDWLVHGHHVFPADIESRLRRVLDLDPMWWQSIAADASSPWHAMIGSWEQGLDIEEGVEALDSLLTDLQTRG